jgi:hypothetical protein
MSSDGSGIRDTTQVELNPPGAELDNGPQPEPIPARPADGATKAKWLDYVVRLGADQDWVSGHTAHWDDTQGRYVQSKALSRDELIELANRLGG